MFSVEDQKIEGLMSVGLELNFFMRVSRRFLELDC